MSLTSAETLLLSRFKALTKVKAHAAKVLKHRASLAEKSSKRDLEDDTQEAKKLKARRILEAEREKEQHKQGTHAFIQESKDNLLLTRTGVGSSNANVSEGNNDHTRPMTNPSPQHQMQPHRPSQLDIMKAGTQKSHSHVHGHSHAGQRPPDKPLEYYLQTVYVGDLNPAATNVQLANEFSPFGRVIEIKIIPLKRFAFVTFESALSTEHAVKGMNGRMCCGGPVRVYNARIPANLKDHHNQYLAAMRQMHVNTSSSPRQQGSSPRQSQSVPGTASPRQNVSSSPRQSVSSSPRQSVSNSPRQSVSNSPRRGLLNSPHQGNSSVLSAQQQQKPQLSNPPNVPPQLPRVSSQDSENERSQTDFSKIDSYENSHVQETSVPSMNETVDQTGHRGSRVNQDSATAASTEEHKQQDAANQTIPDSRALKEYNNI
eukprot:CFRG1886T1